MKKLHKKLEKEINEVLARGICPNCCRLSYKTLSDMAREFQVRKRVVVPLKPGFKVVNAFASKAGVINFKVDNRMGYGNFKLT